MSWFSEFFIDPIKAAIGHVKANPEPAIAALGAAAEKAYAQVQAGTAPAVVASGAADEAMTALEAGLKTAVDGFVTAGVKSAGPLGFVIAPEAVSLANDLLVYGEEQAHTFLANLFHHAKTQIAAAPAA